MTERLFRRIVKKNMAERICVLVARCPYSARAQISQGMYGLDVDCFSDRRFGYRMFVDIENEARACEAIAARIASDPDKFPDVTFFRAGHCTRFRFKDLVPKPHRQRKRTKGRYRQASVGIAFSGSKEEMYVLSNLLAIHGVGAPFKGSKRSGLWMVVNPRHQVRALMVIASQIASGRNAFPNVHFNRSDDGEYVYAYRKGGRISARAPIRDWFPDSPV